MVKKVKKTEISEVHKELKGFSVEINSFGEIETSYSIEQLNDFLNKHSDSSEKQEEE